MLRAIMVCVDYADLLSITLPYNRHHFSEVCVVTTPTDHETQAVAEANSAHVYATTAFYLDGAAFNKWRALEEGLDCFGREGWLCIMDADVMWPTLAPVHEPEIGRLYTPRRRMFEDVTQEVPQEVDWHRYPLHRQEREFAGYTQIFHGSDPHLGPAPWHQTNWRHAGGADSFFQQKWPESHKIRPAWEVLHLGPAGTNWAGRVGVCTDGRRPPGAMERHANLRRLLAGRRYSRHLPDPFAPEKL